MIGKFSCVLCAAFFLAGSLGTPARALDRIALVIGNSDYRHTTVLKNPVSDAELMARTLQQLGFEVILEINSGQNAMKRAMRAYLERLDQSGRNTVGLFYYAGHGVQVDGENFLVPVDARIERGGDVAIEAVSATGLLAGMRQARNRLNIIILDACRNNPFRGFSRSAARGLARLDAPKGSYIVFATAPGDVAADGDGRNSPFTSAMARHLSVPGLNFEQVVKRVGREVSQTTEDRQRPWLSSSVYEDFFPAGAGRLKDIASLPMQTKVAVATDRPAQRQPEQKQGQTFRDCAACPEMVVVPAGRFRMGTRVARNPHRSLLPVHDVEIKRPFAVSKTEITFDAWQACVVEKGCAGYSPRDEGWGKGRQPVIRINWEDAITYIEWLKHKTGKRYRLLSEAEWEYAARGSSDTRFVTGDIITTYQANFDGRRSYNNGPKGTYLAKPVAVASYKPNRFGLFDMHGNVAEWVQDCWHANYDGAPSDGSSRLAPPRGTTCTRRVTRGGSWFSRPRDIRSAARRSLAQHIRSQEVGFRVARDVGN